MQRKAALSEQAAALRAKMTESHLAIFRSEAKNRCGTAVLHSYPVTSAIFSGISLGCMNLH